MNDILIPLDVAEALIALGAIQDKQLDASRLAAISTGDEHEIADLSAKILGRVATRIVDALYPDEVNIEVQRRLNDPLFRADLEAEIEFGLT